MDRGAVTAQIADYIRREFLDGDSSRQLTTTTPLLEWGIIDSMKTARLIAFVRERFGTVVAPQQYSAANFRTIDAVADLVLGSAGRAEA